MRLILSYFFITLRRNDSQNISLIINYDILGAFVNTVSANDQHPVQDCENLQFPIQMQLSSKQKSFSQFFDPFMESPSPFKHFRKKDDRHS